MGVRGWIDGDESGREMLRRVLTETPFLHISPFHNVPLRVGNVVELIGPSPCAKTHLLMQAAIDCILPKHYGGFGHLALFIDLDCRFDILRLSHMLNSRIIQATKNKSDDQQLLGECLRRFIYIRCYDTVEFLATLKTLHYRLEKETKAQGISVNLMMIDSIGAFHWVDRASSSLHLEGDNRKGLSLQNVWTTVVQEIKKLLLLHPMLVLASKATILSNRRAANDVKWNLKRPWSLDSAVSNVTNDKQLMYREYMPSIWQENPCSIANLFNLHLLGELSFLMAFVKKINTKCSSLHAGCNTLVKIKAVKNIVWKSFVTLRILLQVKDDHISVDKKQDKSVYLSEWIMPPLSFADKFVVNDAGVFRVS